MTLSVLCSFLPQVERYFVAVLLVAVLSPVVGTLADLSWLLGTAVVAAVVGIGVEEADIVA